MNIKSQILALISLILLTNSSYAMQFAPAIGPAQNQNPIISYFNKLTKEELQARKTALDRTIQNKQVLTADYVARHNVTPKTHGDHFLLRRLATEIKKLRVQTHIIAQILKTRSDLAIEADQANAQADK